jgi:hypothetical protein
MNGQSGGSSRRARRHRDLGALELITPPWRSTTSILALLTASLRRHAEAKDAYQHALQLASIPHQRSALNQHDGSPTHPPSDPPDVAI